jgi:hypothetical protein
MDVVAKIASISRTEFMQSYNEKYLRALAFESNDFISLRQAQNVFRRINGMIHSHGIRSKLDQYTDLGLLERQINDEGLYYKIVPAVTEWLVMLSTKSFCERIK